VWGGMIDYMLVIMSINEFRYSREPQREQVSLHYCGPVKVRETKRQRWYGKFTNDIQ